MLQDGVGGLGAVLVHHHQVPGGPGVIQQVLQALLPGIRQDAGDRVGNGIEPAVLETEQHDHGKTHALELSRADDGEIAVTRHQARCGFGSELLQQPGEIGGRHPDGAGGPLLRQPRQAGGGLLEQ